MKKKTLISFAFVVVFSASLIGCSNSKGEGDMKEMQSLFETKKEAEKAAKDFGCTGAHKMGSKWMPCSNHGDSGTHQHK